MVAASVPFIFAALRESSQSGSFTIFVVDFLQATFLASQQSVVIFHTWVFVVVVSILLDSFDL